MTVESKLAFTANKSAKITENICDLYAVSLKEATDIFFQSDTSELIEEGVGDLHCRSDKYLATLIWDEYQETRKVRAR